MVFKNVLGRFINTNHFLFELFQVSSIEHQHRPIKQTRSHERLPQKSQSSNQISNSNENVNRNKVPSNPTSPKKTNNNTNNMRKSSSTNDILHDLRQANKRFNATDNQVVSNSHNATKKPLTSNTENAIQTTITDKQSDSASNFTTSAHIGPSKVTSAAKNTSTNQKSPSIAPYKTSSKSIPFNTSSVSMAIGSDADLYAVVDKPTSSNQKQSIVSAIADYHSKTTNQPQQKQQQHQNKNISTASWNKTSPEGSTNTGLYSNITVPASNKNPSHDKTNNTNITGITNKVVQKPPAPTFGGMGVERNRSSVKKGILEDQKALEEKNSKISKLPNTFVSILAFFDWNTYSLGLWYNGH